MWDNLKQMWVNLPLVLSDTYEPIAISLNRILITFIVLNIFLMAWYVLHFRPEMIDKFAAILPPILTFIGALVAQEAFKKGLNTYKEINK